MNGAGVMYNGPWRDDVAIGKDSGEIPEAALVATHFSNALHYIPICVFVWRDEQTLLLSVPGNKTNNWSNDKTKKLFKMMLIKFVSAYEPPFVFLGNENDFYYQQNPNDYLNWINFYNTAYEAIKKVSPHTLIGPVFNFEHLSGSGQLNGWISPNWKALDAHDLNKIDILGITLYPFFAYPQPDLIPKNYLDPLLKHAGFTKPIALIETGWPAEESEGFKPPWETSETAQVHYLSRLYGLIEGKKVKIINWLYLYPPSSAFQGQTQNDKIFGSVSIRDEQGNKRPVYEKWIYF